MKTRSLPGVGLAAVLILGLTACAPEEEDFVLADNPAVTEAIEALNTATPSSTAQAATPTASAPVSMSPAERFDVTEEEYAALVASYTVSSTEFTTPEEIGNAIAARITGYYAGGLNAEDYSEHREWQDPLDKENVGWNAWANLLHTEAFMEALVGPSSIEIYVENKRIIASLWASAVREGDPGFEMTVTYETNYWTPYKTNEGLDSLGLVGKYSSTGNAAENPSLADNNKLPEDSVKERVTFDVTNDGTRWILNEIE